MPERPIECSQCKKCADVIYTEMVGETTTTTEMCRDCPVLKHKLEGKVPAMGTPKKEEGLCCSHCHTSLESVLMGEALGCKDCYFIFQDVLVDQLMETQLISPRLKPSSASPTPTLHIGKSPFINGKSENSTRIRDLNEALSEALKGENYEEAAWLRDQINSLTKASDERA
ncbi:MAG: UvrB/UvrC motif-containing protein [Simkaniaceae bacterium]|nr:MAG: UvrB/UvrC motif-containing protein [Simkaniaceae bacterium]